MDFGYLPQSDLETGNLRTDDQLRDAIRTLQVSQWSSLSVLACTRVSEVQYELRPATARYFKLWAHTGVGL
jgi:hypothetical protein